MTNKTPQEPDWYWELNTTCPDDRLDLISCYLFENGVSGIEEISEEEGRISLRVFFPASVSDPIQLLENARNQFDGKGGEGDESIRIEKKPLENWQEGWRSYFKPIDIGTDFRIRPPWETSAAEKKEIVIYPGQGFGTGYHESTHLALLLLEWIFENRQVFQATDVGTGSGILAIAALLSGVEEVCAIDIDHDSLLEIPGNMTLSGVDPARMTLCQCGPEAIRKSTDLVMANIEGHILEGLATDLIRLTESGGYILLSGILTEYKTLLLDRFVDQFHQVQSLEMNEWSAFVLEKQ